MTDLSLLPAILEFCRRFETQAFSCDADRFVVFLCEENSKLREMLDARDSKLIELMKQIGTLRKKLGS